MMKKILRISAIGATCLLALPLLSGCTAAGKKVTIADASDTVTITPAQQEKPAPKAKPVSVVDCVINEQKSIRRAVNEAIALLEHKQCWNDGEILMRDLLTLAASNRPVPENQAVIGRYIHAMGKKGLLTADEKHNFGRRFFSANYASILASDTVKRKSMNICSICKQGIADQVIDDVLSELKDKELGLLQACDLNTVYKRAKDNADEIIVLLEAACSACSR